MEMQQINGTYPLLGSLFLNGLVNTTSSEVTAQQSRAVSQHEIVETIKNIVMQTESSPEFGHVRLTLGGNDLDIFIVSRPENPVSSQPSQVNPEQLYMQPQLSQDMIHKGVSQIFQHKHFRKDTLMANNPLHKLTIVKQKCQALMCQRKLLSSTLSEYQKASILREFLTNCVDEELCPLIDNMRPQGLSKSPSEAQQRLTEYLILRWQYIDGQPRKEIKKILETEYSCWIRGGTYGRYLEGARKRLSSLIWQKEMQAL